MIVSISHQKGGVGKSTTAWNLATILQNDYTVELVDLDVQRTLTYANELRKQQSDLKPLVIKHVDSPEDLKKYIQEDNDNKISFIDLGGFDSSMNRLSIVMSDLVITPVSDRNFELLGLKTFEKTLIELDDLVEHDIKVKVLLNNISPQKSKLDSLKEYIDKSPHFELLESIFRTRADFDKSVGYGRNVIEYDSESKASNEMRVLTLEIKNILKI